MIALFSVHSPVRFLECLPEGQGPDVAVRMVYLINMYGKEDGETDRQVYYKMVSAGEIDILHCYRDRRKQYGSMAGKALPVGSNL